MLRLDENREQELVSCKISGPPSDTQSLRRELADCIANASAASTVVRIAKETLRRAEARLRDAIATVQRIQSDRDRASAATTEHAAEIFLTALKAGQDLPAIVVPEPPASTALARAVAERDALQAAARELETELRHANDAAAAAAAQVAAIVDDIQDAEARQIADEFVAVQQMSWQLEDRLKGIFILDAQRQRPRLLDLKKAVNMQAHRRNREETRDPQLVEHPKWSAFLEANAREQVRHWHDYAQRLRDDATASIDVEAA